MDFDDKLGMLISLGASIEHIDGSLLDHLKGT